jgi:hypothetical protein
LALRVPSPKIELSPQSGILGQEFVDPSFQRGELREQLGDERQERLFTELCEFSERRHTLICSPADRVLQEGRSLIKDQKCLAHLLKTCGEIERSKTRGAVRFSRRVAALLRKAMALKRRRGAIGDHGYAVLRGKVHAELDRLLAGTYTDPDNARLAKRLRKQREHLLRFLDHDGLDATNNLAEREIRPAVIARKLSAGNRTEAGAETHAVLASVLRTCRRQGRDILRALEELLHQGPGHVIPFDHVR